MYVYTFSFSLHYMLLHIGSKLSIFGFSNQRLTVVVRLVKSRAEEETLVCLKNKHTRLKAKNSFITNVHNRENLRTWYLIVWTTYNLHAHVRKGKKVVKKPVCHKKLYKLFEMWTVHPVFGQVVKTKTSLQRRLVFSRTVGTNICVLVFFVLLI